MKKNLFSKLIACVMAATLFLSAFSSVSFAAPANDKTKVRSLFDASFYYSAYPDVAAAVGFNEDKLFEHYYNFGLNEGRSASTTFNAMAYRNRYPDLTAAFGKDMVRYCVHYVDFGIAEGRSALTDGSLTVSCIEYIPGTEITGELISSYSTKFDKRAARATNVRLAAAQVNGKVVLPGETFSFLGSITPRTAENGYVNAPVFSNKKHSMGIGGGICQVSSTIYAATFGTSLNVTERHAHSLPVTYVPKGMDATVSEGTLDFKFVNTYDRNIIIGTTSDEGVLTVNIYLQN